MCRRGISEAGADAAEPNDAAAATAGNMQCVVPDGGIKPMKLETT